LQRLVLTAVLSVAFALGVTAAVRQVVVSRP
jgi:hypothetical protein